MEEKKIGFFSQLIGSIVKPETYRYFIKRTTGKAILYLFLLSLIFGTLSALRAMYDFNSGITEVISYLQFEVPNFTLENGELNVEGEMPMVFGEDEDYVFIIDTTGNTDESALEPYANGLLLTRYEFIQKENYGIRKQSFAMMQGFSLTKENIVEFLPFLRVINIFIVIFGLIFHFIGKLISALWLAIAGTIISAIVKYKLPFGEQYKLSIYALTLPIVIKALLSIVRINIPYFWVIYYGIGIFYLWKAITLLKQNGETGENINFIEN